MPNVRFRQAWDKNGWALAASLIFTLLVIFAPACRESGWKRVEVRTGRIYLDGMGGTFNFSVRIPAGWTVTEEFPGPNFDYASGLIEGPGVHLTYQAGPGRWWSSDTLVTDPLGVSREVHEVWQESIDGTEANFFRPKGDEPQGFVGALLSVLPAAPGSAPPATLRISNWTSQLDSRWTMSTDTKEIAFDVIRSVRYAPPPKRPRVPESRIEGRDSWELKEARPPGSGRAMFTVLTPPGWSVSAWSSYDAAGAFIEGDGIRLQLVSRYGVSQMREDAHRELWYEEIDGRIVHLFRPKRSLSVGETGAFFAWPASRDSRIWNQFYVAANGLDREHQGLALEIIRTIRFGF